MKRSDMNDRTQKLIQYLEDKTPEEREQSLDFLEWQFWSYPSMCWSEKPAIQHFRPNFLETEAKVWHEVQEKIKNKTWKF